MRADRLNAYSDAVIAILVTIMVLDLKQPEGTSWHDLGAVLPTFFAYALSFASLGVYWNNHHHMLSVVRRIDSRVLWSNHLLLFCLSLIPFTTAWMSENDFARVPTALYGIVLLASGAAYVVLRSSLQHSDGPASPLHRFVGQVRRQPLSIALYSSGIGLSFVAGWAGLAAYGFVAVMWLIPDRHLESDLDELRAAASD